MSDRFEITQTSLAGLTLLRRRKVGDHRGFLDRLFGSEELRDVAGDRTVAQVNHTLTAKRGTVRGMHFQQPPHAEMKFITCLRGAVFDVAVDLRRGSPTFLRWHAERLAEGDLKTFVIPEGFAHGFQALTDDCELLYVHTAGYRADAEGGVNAIDPKLAIAWPEKIVERSDRDTLHPMLAADFRGITL